MANVTASMVKELREKTGAGMMDCKKALQECDGNMDKAIDYLREKGIADSAQKALLLLTSTWAARSVLLLK